MDIERLIGGRLAKLRKEKHITQAQLAEAVDVATETISRIERGISVPSLKTLENISNALDVRLKDLFDFKARSAARVSEADKELLKIVALLKSRKTVEIRLGFNVLKTLLGEIKRNFKPLR